MTINAIIPEPSSITSASLAMLIGLWRRWLASAQPVCLSASSRLNLRRDPFDQFADVLASEQTD